jgi:hypothetical protein
MKRSDGDTGSCFPTLDVAVDQAAIGLEAITPEAIEPEALAAERVARRARRRRRGLRAALQPTGFTSPTNLMRSAIVKVPGTAAGNSGVQLVRFHMKES